MGLEELMGRFMLPTDSEREIPRLSTDEIRQFARTSQELGARMVFNAQINEKKMRRLKRSLAVSRLARVGALDIDEKFLRDPNVWAGPYLEVRGSALEQLPGIMLYAVEYQNNGAQGN